MTCSPSSPQRRRFATQQLPSAHPSQYLLFASSSLPLNRPSLLHLLLLDSFLTRFLRTPPQFSFHHRVTIVTFFMDILVLFMKLFIVE